MSQLALSLEPDRALDESRHYHDPERPGFFSVFVLDSLGKPLQRSYRLEELDARICEYRDRSDDVYLSQNEFFKPNRLAVHLWRLTCLYVDVDTYKVPRLARYGPERLRDLALHACEEAEIPAPSLVVFSGAGLQLKWILDAPAPSRAAPRWQAMQDELCRRLASLGADMAARDVSRVLRLVGSVHSGTGERVRVVHEGKLVAKGATMLATGIIGYAFEELADQLLPVTRASLEAQREASYEAKEARLTALKSAEKARKKAARGRLQAIEGGLSAKPKRAGATPLIASQLAWDRLHDIRKLARLRTSVAVEDGYRSISMFLAACCLADARLVRDILPELEALGAELAPLWSQSRIHSCASAVVARAKAAEEGKTIPFKFPGSDAVRQVDPRYRMTNATMVKMLVITEDEQRRMRTLIGPAEIRRRDLARKERKRREAGAPTRAAYCDRAAERKVQARALRTTGYSIAEISAQLQVSESLVRKALKA